MSVEPENLIKEWWNLYQPDPRSNFDNILSGMRSSVDTSGTIVYKGGVTHNIVKSQQQLGSCQYWIKGLPAVCSHWDTAKNICAYNDNEEPTGYGVGLCDMLGRREWCSQYSKSATDNLEEYVCVAPCIERSGLGRQIKNELGSLSYRPFLPSEIKGYNPDESTGVGRCDGWGMGRGNQKEEFKTLEEIYIFPPMCRQYRPQQMGFGAVQPRPFHGSEFPGKPFDPTVNWIPETLKDLHDGSQSDPLNVMPIRLPFIFQVYNLRAKFQKCAHWDSDSPAFFIIGDYGSDPVNYNIELDSGSRCVCEEVELCDPFRNITEEWVDNLPWVLQDIWAPYGGIVCNGAKPECPCYTGKWNYCNDNLMHDGMRITSDQILELRFWSFPFETKEDYDEFYRAKPGPTQTGYSDETTSDIYTFTKWKKDEETGNPLNSQMVGYVSSLCVPIVLNRIEFKRDTYVTNKVVEYPRASEYDGTNIDGEGVLFPTLVRSLMDPDDFVVKLFVVYPYKTLDPWNEKPCDDTEKPDYCIHDTNILFHHSLNDEDVAINTRYGDSISIVGSCLPNKEIYVINSEIGGGLITNTLRRYKSIIEVNRDDWRKFNDELDRSINLSLEFGGDGIYVGSTNNVGLFLIEGVDLKVNRDNELIVICKFNSSDFPEYTYERVNVLSKYWCASIFQMSAICNIPEDDSGSFDNNFPSWFDYGVSIEGIAYSAYGTLSDVFSVYAFYQYGTGNDISYYSYCINEYNKSAFVTNWVQIGNTGYVWAEIDDENISYLWDFEVDSAKMYYTTSDNDKKNKNLCGNSEDYIELEIIFPNTEDNMEYYKSLRRSIPPNSVLLKAEKPMGFFPSDWELFIEYRYQKLETNMAGDRTVWPENLNSKLSQNRYVESPFTVEILGKDLNTIKFKITNFGNVRSRGSIKLMVFVRDEFGRVQTAAATKFVVQGHILNCRSVDISYIYKGEAIGYSLEPSYGFFTWRGSPRVISAGDVERTHRKSAICGDHECGDPCIGPMWFPFNDCGDMDFYNELNGAAQCTMPVYECIENYEVMGNGGWRYCASSEYEFWVSPGGNWASVCGTSFYYYYSHSTRETVQFSGRVRKMGMVDEVIFKYYGWTLPPFGNKGREMVERFLTREFTSFWDFSMYPPSVRAEFMPMVFDVEDLYYDPNCFSQIDRISPLNEPFVHVPILSNYISSLLKEEVVKGERFRFDDIIEVVYHGNCMYPFPYLSGSVSRYKFKDDSIVWAWPEFWKDIERGVDSDRLMFIELFRPNYYYDVYKKEHRLIMDEGKTQLEFEPNDSEDSFPKIGIGGGPKRLFKLVYDNYDSIDNVEWMDETSTGDGGTDGENIYELANNGKGQNRSETEGSVVWFHSFDTLFSKEASADPSDERKISFVDYDAYYNRGVVAKIPINKLISLPVEKNYIKGQFSNEDNNGFFVWFDISNHPSYKSTVTNINIKGSWGINSEGDVFSMPSVKAFDHNEEIELTDDVFDSVYTSKENIFTHGKSGREGIYLSNSVNKFEEYNISIGLFKYPIRFVTSNDYFYIRLLPIGSEKVICHSVEVEVSTYVKATENVNVWEKKFEISKGDFGSSNNSDGVDSDKYRAYDLNLKNAGQYFPYRNFDDEGGSVLSKTNLVSFGKFYNIDENEEIPTTLDSLKKNELDLQNELYEIATELDDYDELLFHGHRSPVFSTIAKEIGGFNFTPGALVLKSSKINWENNIHYKNLTQKGDIIQRGGHYFKWSDSITRDRCYIFGPIQDIFSVRAVHHKHGKDEQTLDAGHSYRGWGRLAYLEGRLWQMEFTGSSNKPSIDIMTSAINFAGGTGGLELQ